jgi:Ca2+-transporting ATPase
MTLSTPATSVSNTTWHRVDIEETLNILDTNPDRGLTSQQVQERQKHYGLNELTETAGRSNFQILLDQFTNIMLVMLIAVAIISGILDYIDLQAGKTNGIPFKDTIAIMLIVILNGVLGYLQESRAEKALAALKRMSTPKVRVIRDGRTQEVDGKELVPGDVMLLEGGVQPAADGRLISSSNLQIREAALTGEAEAVSKKPEAKLAEDIGLGDRVNLVYQGTEVIIGRGTAVVTQTGMQTELGKIATMLQGVESEPTPLQQRMEQLGNVLVTGSLILVVIVVVGGMIPDLIKGIFNFDLLKELVEVSLSMAVAVVPEGLPAVITVTLALGTQRMVKRNALIRKLPAVETLGSVTTICSDKTGTLTQNKMVVQRVETLETSVSVTGEGYIPTGEFQIDGVAVDTNDYPEVNGLLFACVLCNDSILEYKDNQWQIIGDPTEGALVVLAQKATVDRAANQQQFPRVAEFPFDSERKRMSVICSQPNGYFLYTKGSPEIILERCKYVQIGNDAIAQARATSAIELTDSQRQQILDRNNQMASKGLRVLGFAYQTIDALPQEDEADKYERDLIWLGLVGMLDAARPEVKDAVAKCRTAGIRPMMITGDHQLTAQAIAKFLGIAEEGAPVVTGLELARMNQEQLEDIVDDTSVYARVAPEHKLRIVQALQKRGKFVAMTGDGVNDAPALKQADIGIAMGITGTDVSKEASDMVLLDDNFATIVAATEEGRVVYSNIRRFIKYILGSNIGEVLTIAASPLIGLGGVPLSPLQILWMNLVTDGLPALALAVEPADPTVMQRPPASTRESIFARGLGSYMVRIGIIFGVLSIAMMKWAYDYTHAPGYTGNPNEWKTMVFTTLCIAQMGHALAVRSNNRLLIEMNLFSNPFLLWAVVITTLLQLALVYVPPMQRFFGTHPLSGLELAVCIGFSLLMLVWIEGEKLFIRTKNKGKIIED